MLPRADLGTNRPPGSVEATTPLSSATDARQEAFRRLTQIAIGKELSATVLAQLDDGTHLVKVADTQARMALPVGAKVGDQLSLVFIAREPRPTFLLSTQAGSANASLSAAGRLIDQLLQGAGQDADAGAVRASTPLLGSASADAGQLAANLRQALSSSGLFYEAHLQEWIAGSRSTAELAEEPQARFADRSATQGTQGNELGRLSQGLRELGNDAQALLRLIRDAHQQQAALQADAHVITRPQAGPAALDPELARLVQSQLHTLEQQQVRWQGELWPGQHMEWDVTEERPHDDPDRREGSAWTSVVRFELPHLGPVEATLRLVGEHVQLQVKTEGDAAATSLRAHAPLLAEALDAVGSPLEAFQVQRGEGAGDEHST